MDCSEQEVEAGVATKWMHQGVVLVLGVLAGEVVQMEVTATTTDQEGMVSTGKVPVRTECSQVTIKCEEMDRIHHIEQLKSFEA